MNSRKLRNRCVTSILGFALLALSSCSNRPVVQDFPATANPATEISKLESDVNRALSNQADVLSPHNFKEAANALDDAKKGLDRQNDSKDILHDVALGRAYLSQALDAVHSASTNMESVVQARQRALSAGARIHFKDDLKNADKELTNVTSDIEKNDFKSTEKNRTALQEKYLNLELLAIKESNLGAIRQNIETAKTEGAKEYAPRSLALAEKNYKDADEYITGNRQNIVEVKAKSNAAAASAEHALKITRQSKLNKKTAPEEVALQLESEQKKVSSKEDELMEKQAELNSKNSELAAQNAITSELTAEQIFQNNYEKAQAAFEPNEAEVYKQGNALVIRLRSLAFPTNKAVLKEQDFTLLAKVQSVIKSFGDTSVIVEGHTDSVGGKAANEKLSTKRALAVKEYLVSNESIDRDKVTSMGYGYQRPLATNKTAEGRAQNRRVDILITPDKSAGLRHTDN